MKNHKVNEKTETTQNAEQIQSILSNPAYQADSQTLGRRAFGMPRKVGSLLKQLYVFLTTPDLTNIHGWLQTIKNWQLVPYTLWPVDFAGMGRFVCTELAQGKTLDPQMAVLLDLVKDLPSHAEQEAIGDYEHAVQLGDYDPLLRSHAKYQAREKELLADPAFHAHLKLLDEMFDLASRANDSGIIRRTMVCERNFRIFKEFLFDWSDEEKRFLILFDAFCWRYDLYGLENKLPLLMKVTVNPTPHGLIIYVPRWMSVDMRRDFIWNAVTDLQKVRIEDRQGPKLSEGRLERKELAKRVYLADRDAKKLGLTGRKRWEHIFKETGLFHRTDVRRIRELIQEGYDLLHPNASAAAKEKIENVAVKPVPNPKLARARKIVEALAPEEKQEFIRMLSE